MSVFLGVIGDFKLRLPSILPALHSCHQQNFEFWGKSMTRLNCWQLWQGNIVNVAMAEIPHNLVLKAFVVLVVLAFMYCLSPVYAEITFICIALQLLLYFGFINDSQQIQSHWMSSKVQYSVNNQVPGVGRKYRKCIAHTFEITFSIIQVRMMMELYVLECKNMIMSYRHLNKW